VNREECIELLRQTGCNSDVIAHSIAVADVALGICDTRWEGLADCELIEAGALLHDIGRSKTQQIDHAVLGVEIGRELGLDPRLLLIIERHIGAGIVQKEAEALGLPAKDYLPETIEEKIVAHADNLVDDTTRITFHERIKQVEKKLTEAHVNRMQRLHAEVCGQKLEPEIFCGYATIMDVKQMMNRITEITREHGPVIQIVDGDFVAGEAHVRSAVYKAIRSMNAGEAITSSLGLEILLYLAGTRHISKALEIGVKEGKGRVYLIIIGDEVSEGVKAEIFELLSFQGQDFIRSSENKEQLMTFFGITEEEIGVADEDKLEMLVIERGALLEVLK